MLTTCLIVLIFGSRDFHYYQAKLRMRLQVRQLLRVLFLCYHVVLPCTLLLSSVSTTIFPTVYAWYQLKYYTTTPKPASIT